MSDDTIKITLMHAREDGTYVVMRNNMPYHVVKDDPLYEAVKEAADAYGELPPEPAPQPVQLFNTGR